MSPISSSYQPCSFLLYSVQLSVSKLCFCFFWVTVCLRFFLGHLFLPLGASVQWGRGETAALKHGGLERHHVDLWLSIRSRGRYYPEVANDSPLGPARGREEGRGAWFINPFVFVFVSGLLDLGFVFLEHIYLFVTLSGKSVELSRIHFQFWSKFLCFLHLKSVTCQEFPLPPSKSALFVFKSFFRLKNYGLFQYKAFTVFKAASEDCSASL